MAGMFYSLEETAAKLNMNEAKIRELIREGRLREFSDGPNVLFKVSEVESLMHDTGITSSSNEDDAEPMLELSDDELTLAPETDLDVPIGEELTNADTAVGSAGVNVLGETDLEDYKLSEDTMSETISGTAAGSAGGSAASLDEIDESVNLDTFGSGSGLLDLSLQADDTSLGGILDEIYTPEGEAEDDAEAPMAASAVQMADEADQLMPEQYLGVPQAAVMAGYIEMPADKSSNIFGWLLLLPLAVVIYTVLVVMGSLSGQIPVVMSVLNEKGPINLHMIWIVMAGIGVVALIWAMAGAMAGGSRTRTAKPKKEKAGKVKPVKEKKVKPAKAPKKK
ncbi:MAG: hypothetical protein E4H16_01505 [Candidatus Atribacteria bacterium]|nr:MAG: hypothetical protein E4H16_01505 [Candidatus Atribacteria bacterium]